MKKREAIPGKSIRNHWQINPVTRVHDNNFRKNKKKTRQDTRRAINEGYDGPFHMFEVSA